MNFQTTSKFAIVSVRVILPKVGADRFTGPFGKSTSSMNLVLNFYEKPYRKQIENIAAFFGDF